MFEGVNIKETTTDKLLLDYLTIDLIFKKTLREYEIGNADEKEGVNYCRSKGMLDSQFYWGK